MSLFMQVALERTEVESDCKASEEKLQCLRKLPGFSTRSQRDLVQMLLDHPVSVKTAIPQQTLFSAGAHINHVRSSEILVKSVE